MDTVHNYEQVMAWQPSDVRDLIGSHLVIREPANDAAYWADPHGYAGEFDTLASGLVTDVAWDGERHRRRYRVVFEGGGWFAWEPGQPIYITETKEA